ncbi:mitochondrial coenzyme A transporter SLC25A42-like [Mercenaria mercenaria]|uniref:mitochondrial coenzyme A transporter SLC25A42-like n=1 Tax=Mercenaria mercenaria TaxID=6596 RepID=UPI00234F383C|nr:mitochondrial coenzyme A transporter SLC25A42-like [Mercenaria mercenaria]XP_053387703.1 mitochondrial coenzyme A transporter SLC25A42-like [Mercenaria mercenaria]XP_053387704.1 mitochondrial coenzyme A transporter SLC25A42-like [Mercenaria mercenaria]XP_053387705.1 mitochondrial coenzyme A transporter SLC25A42-like [Mercenaria mercenaria]XP_053387706.1 mitochondrial coenzyme A transporter SLC25A42-like [Mercenaria mercenaria]XP_053387707.1 mitochondrial coenzyme A transporter SLC25A42-like
MDRGENAVVLNTAAQPGTRQNEDFSEGREDIAEVLAGSEEHHNHNNHHDEHFHREEHDINQKVSNHNKILTSFIAGGFAGAIAKTTIAPLDRTKINFQTSNTMRFSFKKAIQFLIKTYKSEGVLALWRGNSATMVRIVPYAAIQYTAHEQYKLLLNKGKKRKNLPPVLRAVAGSLAGVTATTCTYPLDFARARMAVTHKDRYRSLIACFRSVLKEEGWRIVMRGYTPTMFGSCIYSGISFFTYETLKIIHAEYTKGVDPTPLERWYCGAVAGICGQCSSYPLDIVRRRMQTAGVTGHSKDYTTIYRTAKTVYIHEGLKGGLYKGLSMNWIKGPVSAGISFMTFETVRMWLRKFPIFHIDSD